MKPRRQNASTVGRDDLGVLAPEQATFAGMRVERGDAEPRVRDAEGGQRLEGQLEDLGETRGGHQFRRARESDMGADMRDAKVLVRQHHAGIRRTGQGGQHLRMPGIGVTGEIDGLLRDGAGHDPGDVPRERVAHRALDGREGALAGGGRDGAGLDRRSGVAGVDDGHCGPACGPAKLGDLDGQAEAACGLLQDAPRAVDDRGRRRRRLAMGQLGKRLERYLGADARGVADRYAKAHLLARTVGGPPGRGVIAGTGPRSGGRPH